MISLQRQCCSLAADFIEHLTLHFLQLRKYVRIEEERYKIKYFDIYTLYHMWFITKKIYVFKIIAAVPILYNIFLKYTGRYNEFLLTGI
jgi:hypothetical protein